MRVVDEAQIERHYEGHDLAELYNFDPKSLTENGNQRPAYAPPKDLLLADVLHNQPDTITDFFQHDTLFANVDNEKLTDEECREAWEDYEQEKKGIRANTLAGTNQWNAGRGANPLQGLSNEQRAILERQQVRIPSAMATIQSDPIFLNCFLIKNMENDTAVKITYIKRVLEELLPKIPMHMRGGITEFTGYFHTLINEVRQNNQKPAYLQQRAISVFRTVVKMTKDVLECKTILRQIYNSTPMFFDPLEPPP
ncbi:unnamed protein product, partial [Mesorhabditis belari]